MGVRFQNKEECVAVLDEIFGAATLEEWKQRLADFSGVWAPVLDVKEVHDHPQIEPNGYLPELTDNDGITFRIVVDAHAVRRAADGPQRRRPGTGPGHGDAPDGGRAWTGTRSPASARRADLAERPGRVGQPRPRHR